MALTAPAIACHGEEIVPSTVTNSGCKSDLNAPSINKGVYDDPESFWTVSYNDGKLVVIWHNLIADCAASDFQSKITREDDTLTFTAWYTPGAADCLCPYDITSTYEDIAPGHYTIVFGFPGNPIMTGEVDLEEGYTGQFKVSQSGISKITKDDSMLRIEDGVAKINCPGKFRLDIINANGVNEGTLENENEAEVILSGLCKGIHYLRLTPVQGNAVTLPVLR